MKFDPPFVQATSLLSSRTILELGSGTGMVSSHIAEILDNNNDIIIVTDLPEVIDMENSIPSTCTKIHQIGLSLAGKQSYETQVLKFVPKRFP